MTLAITSDLCMQLLRWHRFINTENTTKVSHYFCVRLQLFFQPFFGHLFALLWNVAAAAAADLVAGLARKSKQLEKNKLHARTSDSSFVKYTTQRVFACIVVLVVLLLWLLLVLLAHPT